jgi:hypothetical protein
MQEQTTVLEELTSVRQKVTILREKEAEVTVLREKEAKVTRLREKSRSNQIKGKGSRNSGEKHRNVSILCRKTGKA